MSDTRPPQSPSDAQARQPQTAPSTRPAHPAGPHGPGHAPPPRRRGFSGWMVLGLVLLAVAGLVWFVLAQGKQPQGGPGGRGASAGRGGRGGGGPGGNMPTTVSVAQVTQGDVPIYLNELGSVTPLATVTVRSQISGYLLQIAFREGQMVSRGQFLAQIDPRPYQAALMQAQGALARDQAALAEAQLDLKRYQTLLAQDSIARQQVDIQAATVQQDLGTVKSDEATIATQKLNIAYAHITSPVTGRVGLRQVDVGNYVSAGDTNGVVVVTQLAPIDVLFTLPEDNLPQVQARIRAGASLPVTAFDRTGQTQLALGRLLTLDNVIDPTTGTVKAKARFDNGSGDLFPQQFVNVRILVDTLRGATVAPTAAVLRGANGLFVYVVQGVRNNHTVTVRNVTTGPSDGAMTAILSGVQSGDTVVTDGTDRLREGARVILPGDCIPMMGGGAGGRGGRGGRRGAGGAQASGGTAAGGSGGGHSGSSGCPAGQQQAVQRQAAGSGGAQQAETPDQGGQNRGPGSRMQAMLAQLDLDPQQQLKAQAIFQAARGDVMTAAANAGDNPQARAAAVRQVYGRAFDQLNPILRPDQRAKLAQLRAQMAQGGGHVGGGGQGGGHWGGAQGGGGGQGGGANGAQAGAAGR